MFISFEGIDGSGKSTQIALLADALHQAGYQVLTVREPGGTSLSEAIRDIVLHHKGDITPFSEMLLFSAARHQLVKEVIQPALNEGKIVIADRFFDSTLAYQGAGRHLMELSRLKEFQLLVTEGLKPQRTFFLDISLELSHQRRALEVADRMENATQDFFERVNSYYRSLALLERDRILQIDGTHSTQEIHDLIMEDLLDLWLSKK